MQFIYGSPLKEFVWNSPNYLPYSIFGRWYMYIYGYKSCISIVPNSINNFVLISCWQKHKNWTATQNETWKFSRKARINNDCKSSDDDAQSLPDPPMMIHLSSAPGFLGRQRDNCIFTRHLPGILISRKSRNCCGGKAGTFSQNFKGTQVTTKNIYIYIFSYVCIR